MEKLPLLFLDSFFPKQIYRVLQKELYNFESL
jgi:hypothetical protein